MKKFFIAISVLAALTFCMVPAQANMGLPDDVPGCDAVLPFLVGMNAPAINTLVVFTDVRGYGGAAGWNYHYTVNTIKSVTLYNDNLPGTSFDIVSTDAYTIIMKMAPAIRAQLEIDLDGDTVNDHWAGYIYFDQLPLLGNQMIGQTLLLNIQQGQAAAANTWLKENWLGGALPFVVGGQEVWSANALASAESRVMGGVNVNATAFGLYPRYYINDANTGQTCLFLWKDANWAAPTSLHVFFYNDEEKKVSSNIPVPYELNIICLDPAWLPVSLFSGYPREGWIALEVPDINGAGFFAGVTDWAGYTWVFATGAAAESWSYLTQIHRDVQWGGSWDNFGGN